MTASRKPTPSQRNCGFTLLELVVSSVMISAIMLGLGSAMLIAARAMPQAENATGSVSAAAGVAEQLAAELRYATAVTARSSTGIEFTVADRNNDSLPETIRYEWSGTAGSPLTRRYNAGTAAEMLAKVNEFGLSYDTEALSEIIARGNESAETRLLQYTSSWYYADYAIRDASRYAMYFFPDLPTDAVSWTVTRVRFYARQGGLTNTGEVRVQLQSPTTGGTPSSVIIDEGTLYESTLSTSYLVREIPYSKATGLSPTQGLCLVFQWQTGYSACEVLGRSSGVAESNIALVKTADQGASWYALSGQSLFFAVYGTVTTAGTPAVEETCRLKGVQIRLRANSDGQSLVQTAVETLNQPEVSP